MRALWVNVAWAVLAAGVAVNRAAAGDAWLAMLFAAFAGWSLCHGIMSDDD